jgi:hypothetical protein
MYCDGVATIGAATLGVGFPNYCPMASPGSCVLNMASFDGVATLGASLPAPCPMSSQGSPALSMASLGNVATPRLTSVFHVVFDGIRTFMYAKYAVLCRRHVFWRPDAPIFQDSKFGRSHLHHMSLVTVV